MVAKQCDRVLAIGKREQFSMQRERVDGGTS
jgi:hypothetical protein